MGGEPGPQRSVLIHTTADVPLWRRARRRAYWMLLAGLLAAADRMPLVWVLAICRVLAALAWQVRPREVALARRNLAAAFPERDAADIENLARESARAAGRNLFTALAAGRVLEKEIIRERGPRDDEDRTLTQVVGQLQQRGRGVFFLTGHIGSWEMLGAHAAGMFAAAGLGRLGVVTGTLHNPPVNRLVQQRREKLGMKVLPREEGLRPVLRHLASEGLVAFLLDQNTHTRNRAVPFFGRPAPTPEAMALVALQKGIPVVPLALIPMGNRFEVHWLNPLEPAGPPDEPDLRLLEDYLARCNRALETLIARNPAQWVWFHDRWGA